MLLSGGVDEKEILFYQLGFLLEARYYSGEHAREKRKLDPWEKGETKSNFFYLRSKYNKTAGPLIIKTIFEYMRIYVNGKLSFLTQSWKAKSELYY